ncbi:hypothetical protein HY449_00960 [Candidatus Pacearchaeota archaeon]|nr:hypothetical protein [Candidatus Pacearchaeota archaeon]
MSKVKDSGYYGYKDDVMELKSQLAQRRKPVLEKRVTEFKNICQVLKLRDEEIAQVLGFYSEQYYDYGGPDQILRGDYNPRGEARERIDNFIQINVRISKIFNDTATRIAYLNSEQPEFNGKSVLHMLKEGHIEMIEAADFVSALQESNQ